MAYNPFLLNQSIQQFGQNQLAKSLAMQEIARQREQDAMKKELHNLQMGEYEKAKRIDDTIAGLYSPQRAAGTGPMRGVANYQPGRMEVQPPSFEKLRNALAPEGMAGLAAAEQFRPQPVDPFEGYEAGYETFARANRLPPNDPRTYAAYQDNILAQKRAGATNVTQTVDARQTKGREKTDEAFAKEYVDYVASGGYADTMKQVNQLRGVVEELETRDDLTGPLIGSVPDSVKKFTNPDAIATREAVEEVVQRNLRLVLGAQFTEKEGERLISRAYNPNLSEEENAKRLRSLLGQIEQAAKAKKSAADYFQKKGTLTGWKGNIPSIDDFYTATAPKSATEYLNKFGGQ